MKNKIIFSLTIVSILALLISYSIIQKQRIPKEVSVDDANLILVVSGSGNKYPIMDFKIYIDGELYIDDYFKDFNNNSHSQYYHYYSLSKGKHTIKIVTEKANEELVKEFEITRDKHWAHIKCYNKIEFTYSDEAFIFAGIPLMTSFDNITIDRRQI